MFRIKRFFKKLLIGITIILMIGLFFIANFLYTFDANDNSQWVSELIQEYTGYDVRFERLTSSLWSDNQLSFKGVSLYQGKQRLIFIKKIDVTINKWDLLQQQLNITEMYVDGAEVRFSPTMYSPAVNKPVTIEASPSLQHLALNRLHIETLTLTNLNIQVMNKTREIALNEMQLTLNDVLLIEHNLLQNPLLMFDITANIKSLMLSNDNYRGQINESTIKLQGNLLQRQAQLELRIGSIESYAPLISLQAIKLNLRWNNNNVQLEQFSLDAYSGKLMMQGNMHIEAYLFPKLDVKVKQVILTSLLLKNMQLRIPAFNVAVKDPTQAQEKNLLWLEELQLNSVKLENVSVLSNNKAWPLKIKNLQAQLNEVDIIKAQHWINLTQVQSGTFFLAFDALNWGGTRIEKFYTAGSLDKKKYDLLDLQKLLKH